MSAEKIIFFLLASMILTSGYLSVVTRNIFRAAIFLLFALVGIAGVYFMLAYEFVAAVQIVVYVGGIVVLIIFSIFLTQQIGVDLPVPKPLTAAIAALVCLGGFLFTIYQLANNAFIWNNQDVMEPSVKAIGTQMLDINQTGYALPFEVISILLLAAMIGCIVIA